MTKSQHMFLAVACALGGLSVILGAFAAHGLKGRLEPDLFNAFEVGVRYQMYHALALLAVSLGSGSLWKHRAISTACWAWTAGSILFSGSLYLLAITGIRWLGAITPIGGLAFIAGWVFLGITVLQYRSE